MKCLCKRTVVWALFVWLSAATCTMAAKSNRDNVRAELGKDGWSVIWGKNFTEADWARGTKAIAESIATDNPGPFLAWFESAWTKNYEKISRNLEGISRGDLERWIVDSLKQKKVITYKNFRIQAGFATYNRWESLIYDEPRTRRIKRPPFVEAYTKRVEKKVPLPNWHQFYIRYKLAQSSPKDAGGKNQSTPLAAKYRALGGERGLLGPPLHGAPGTAELIPPDKVGRFVHFRHGSIYWSPKTGAFEIHGDIRKKWESLRWETGLLGYPTTDELTTPDKIGRFNHFQGGSIYWTPKTGAHEIHGDILKKWASLGYERSFLGYPVTDELNTPDGKGKISKFERGYIDWYPGRGAIEHRQ